MKVLILMFLSFVLGVLAYHYYQQGQSPRTPSAIIKVERSSGKTAPATSTTAAPAGTPVPGAVASAEDTHATTVTTAPSLPTPVAGAVSRAGAAALLLPVQGITREQLHDTFTDARSEGRSHDAIDIMAPAGTPVLAVADGSIEKLFTSERGGLTLYQFEPTGRLAYYYAHLQRYADGLAQGQTIRRGQVIGYVGSTGNASPEAPHLHFAIFVLGPERHWWEGQAINPYPVLQGTASP